MLVSRIIKFLVAAGFDVVSSPLAAVVPGSQIRTSKRGHQNAVYYGNW
ncbi:unnamed protein product [Discula destructiva]